MSCYVCCEAHGDNELFSCEEIKCVSDETEAKAMLCEDCIISHIKRGHKILDSKSEEPLVCCSHKLIVSIYCKNCRSCLCVKCLVDHVNHEIQTIDTKSKEVKSLVFDLLTGLEVKEKPFRLAADLIESSVARRRNDLDALKKCFEDQTEELRKDVFEQIELNSKFLDGRIEEVNTTVGNLLKQQEKARNLLSVNNARVVENFAGVDQEAKSVLQDLESAEQLTEFRFIATREMKEKFKAFNANLVKQINICEVDPSQEKHFVASDFTGDLIEISAFKASLKCFYCYPIDQTWFYRCISADNAFADVIDRVFPVQPFGDNTCAMILTTDSTVYLLNKESGNIERDEKLPADFQQNSANYLWPHRTGEKGSEFDWVLWNAKAKRLTFTHDMSLSIPFKSMPFIKMSCYVWCMLVFVGSDKSVICVDIAEKTIRHIPPQVHKLDKIDCVSTYGINLMFLWSTSTKSTVVLSLLEETRPENDVEWQFSGKFSWDDQKQTTQISLKDGKRFNLLPYYRSECSETSATKKHFPVFCVNRCEMD
ncbi:uncharacterized protein LOC142349907 [Convolutriloba macropyga]|uniref:uncharacterized protein LOC142349907 n=1 Tax=Convolutriloba macropyga TaxID=536237 RepID=UPI003F51BA14